MTDDYAELNADDVVALVDKLKPVLKGYPPPVQGAALADLLALWLAGHRDPRGFAETTQLRAALLEHHMEHVRQLIPVNEAEIWTN
jgi:hypothetical protein